MQADTLRTSEHPSKFLTDTLLDILCLSLQELPFVPRRRADLLKFRRRPHKEHRRGTPPLPIHGLVDRAAKMLVLPKVRQLSRPCAPPRTVGGGKGLDLGDLRCGIPKRQYLASLLYGRVNRLTALHQVLQPLGRAHEPLASQRSEPDVGLPAGSTALVVRSAKGDPCQALGYLASHGKSTVKAEDGLLDIPSRQKPPSGAQKMGSE